MPDSVVEVTTDLNYAFTCFFGVELVIKFYGLGYKLYMAETMNIFDAVVTIAGLVEMAIDLSPATVSDGGTSSAATCGICNILGDTWDTRVASLSRCRYLVL
jgi:hypothetical protein